MSDVLSTLPPLTWRGISVPYEDLKTEFKQDDAEHKPWGVDGSRLEPTGRGARVVSCKAMFLNRGTVFEPTAYSEPWFPDVYLRFVQAMEDRSVGTLFHPTRGALLCVPTSGSDTISSRQRDGVVLECSWAETLEDESLADYPQQGDLALLVQSARSLDAALAALNPPLPKAATPSVSFEALVQGVTGAFDSVSLAQQQVGGKVASIIGAASRVRDAMQRAWDSSMGPALNAVERLISALHAKEAAAASSQRKTAFYVVPSATTLGAIAYKLGAKVDDVLTLNPSLATLRVVPRETLVRYYAR